METRQLLFALLRISICGEQPTENIKNACTEQALQEVIQLARRHDLAHLIGQAASKLQLPDCALIALSKKAAMHAFMRHARQDMVYQSACALLEKGEVPFIPLKGSVLKEYYPEPWMRTSCDMDILVHEEDLAKVQPMLEAEGWKYQDKTSHDLGFLSPEGVRLELHYTTIEDYVSEKGKAIMDGVWEDAMPLPGKQYHMVISDPLYYYYHMVHMAKHFTKGGCGIRSFLDIWILQNKMQYDQAARDALLEKGDVLSFARGAEKMSRIWFAREETDPLSAAMEDFVVEGGTYGTLQNQVNLRQTQEGNKWNAILKRIFMPYIYLKHSYPILQKHRWLMPVFQVVRWFRILFGGRMKESVRELQVNAEATGEGQNEAKRLIEYLGL